MKLDDPRPHTFPWCTRSENEEQPGPDPTLTAYRVQGQAGPALAIGRYQIGSVHDSSNAGVEGSWLPCCLYLVFVVSHSPLWFGPAGFRRHPGFRLDRRISKCVDCHLVEKLLELGDDDIPDVPEQSLGDFEERKRPEGACFFRFL